LAFVEYENFVSDGINIIAVASVCPLTFTQTQAVYTLKVIYATGNLEPNIIDALVTAGTRVTAIVCGVKKPEIFASTKKEKATVVANLSLSLLLEPISGKS
jgi:hypothetical protein